MEATGTPPAGRGIKEMQGPRAIPSRLSGQIVHLTGQSFRDGNWGAEQNPRQELVWRQE